MRFLSVCSGIEAASVAWEPLGWEPAAFAEIDPFACAVLAHRYPHVPNLDDFTQIGANDVGSVDLLIGGTPCQDFSVAGLRAGMAGDRGQLTIEFLRLAARVRPEWVVWENVPGVLSADRGLAFGTFLGGLADIGYGFAYRVLDAQFFGVAQRRRRVFVVGRLGDWRGAAAVLFERASLSGHPAPRRKAGKVAPTIPSRSSAGGGLGSDFDCDGGLIASFTPSSHGTFSRRDAAVLRANAGGASGGTETLVAGTLRASASGVSRVGRGEAEMLVAHTLKAEGHDANEDGTGRSVPLVVEGDICATGNVTHPLTAARGHAATEDGTGRGAPLVVAFTFKDFGDDATEDLTPTLRIGPPVGGNGMLAVAFQQNSRSEVRLTGGDGETVGAVIAEPGAQGQNCVAGTTAVRRLTPRECERLQGFPDDWTLVPDPRRKGKLAADAPRYRALGNSMAVPVIRWLGERIMRVVERSVP